MSISRMILWNLVLIKALIPYQLPVEKLPILKGSSDEITRTGVGTAFARLWNGVGKLQGITSGSTQQEQGVEQNPAMLDYAMWIWAAGVVCFLFYFLCIYVKEYRALKESRSIKNPALERMIYD